MTDRRRDDALDRLLKLARRKLGGVRLLSPDDPAVAEAPLQRELPDGRVLVVDTDPEARDLEHLAARLELVLSCFAGTLEAQAPSSLPRRPSIPEVLHRELDGLARRVGAFDAFVIDIDSPVVWCSARAGPATDGSGQPITREARIAARRMRPPRLRLVDDDYPPPDQRRSPGPAPVPEDQDDHPSLPELTERAIERLHDLPDLSSLRRGRRLREAIREPGLGLLARSLADIYLLALVFRGDFAELPAERALTAAMPRIERLIQGLPPLDPTPRKAAKVTALRRG